MKLIIEKKDGSIVSGEYTFEEILEKLRYIDTLPESQMPLRWTLDF